MDGHWRAMGHTVFERLCGTLVGRNIGKRTRSDVYVHRSVVEKTCEPAIAQLDALWKSSAENLERWNVLRIAANCSSISLLLYPSFYEFGHPVLHASLKAGKDLKTPRLSDFRKRTNKPVLHRKELLVDKADEWFPAFQKLSAQEAEMGLLNTGDRIGYERGWSWVLQAAGVDVHGHHLVRAMKSEEHGTNRKA